MNKNYTEYEKIVDVWNFGDHIFLEFHVIFGNKNLKSNMRESFHAEFAYTTTKYAIPERVINIRRNLHYFLTFGRKGNDEASILIQEKDMLAVQKLLLDTRAILETCFSQNSDGILVCTNTGTTPTIIGGKVVEISPRVIIKDEIYIQAVAIIINDNETIYLDIDNFMKLAYILGTFNMYQSASILAGYLQPEIGQRVVEYNEAATQAPRSNPYLYADENTNSFKKEVK